MGQSTNQQSPQPAGSSRPQLMGAKAATAEHNILDAMSSRPASAPKPSRREWWWLFPLLAALAWWASHGLMRTPPVSQPALSTAASVTATAGPASAPQPPAETPSVADAQGVAPAASVGAAAQPTGPVTDPFQTLAAAPTATPAEATRKPATDLQPSPDAAVAAAPLPGREPSSDPAGAPLAAVDKAKPKATPPQTVAVAKTAPTPKPATKPANKPPSVAARKASEDKTAARPGTDAAKPVKAAAPARPGPQDPDVELLSAIMKHLGDGKSAGAGVTQGNVAAQTRSAQTIAELVKSCKTKDSIEALLCQRRICEGSWGKAEACPLGMAPKAAEVADTR